MHPNFIPTFLHSFAIFGMKFSFNSHLTLFLWVRLFFNISFEKLKFSTTGRPKVVIAHTIKGKGVSFTEGHGPWHHRVPSDKEMLLIAQELSE